MSPTTFDAMIDYDGAMSPTTFDVMVDYDDVIFPLAQRLHSKAHEMGLHDNTKEALEVWHGEQQYGCSKDQWLAVFDALIDEDAYTNLEPIPGVVEALRRLWWEGHRIHIVTARGMMAHADEIRRATYDHAAEFAVPYDTLTFTKDKVAAQDELGVRFDFAIDDGSHNYEALDAAGVKVYLLDVPHNRDFEVPQDRRVATVDEFVDIILQEAS